MKKRVSNSNTEQSKAHGYRFTVGRFLEVAVALVFLVFIGRFLYIGISNKVNGQNLTAKTEQLYMRNQVLKANRGTIYDRNGLAVAQDSHLYTIYAILDKSSINYKNKPEYVVDKNKTAQKLSQVLPLKADKILNYLNPSHSVFQVQFGTAGSNLTKKQKVQIEKMKLPGIKFFET
ncbi:MAG: penicillin-binding protein, partial [Lactobacillus sp.]|nr:penicillin-binding protein [Lactobacillus sp.]